MLQQVIFCSKEVEKAVRSFQNEMPAILNQILKKARSSGVIWHIDNIRNNLSKFCRLFLKETSTSNMEKYKLVKVRKIYNNFYYNVGLTNMRFGKDDYKIVQVQDIVSEAMLSVFLMMHKLEMLKKMLIDMDKDQHPIIEEILEDRTIWQILKSRQELFLKGLLLLCLIAGGSLLLSLILKFGFPSDHSRRIRNPLLPEIITLVTFGFMCLFYIINSSLTLLKRPAYKLIYGGNYSEVEINKLADSLLNISETINFTVECYQMDLNINLLEYNSIKPGDIMLPSLNIDKRIKRTIRLKDDDVNESKGRINFKISL